MTPFVGVGAAAGGARADATQTVQARDDQRHDIGAAGSLILGVIWNLTDSIGLTTDYEFLCSGIGGGLSTHSINAGLRYTF